MQVEGFPVSHTLTDGTAVVFRLTESGDGASLLEFFRGLPEQDRLYLRDDVTTETFVERYLARLGRGNVFSLVAESDGFPVAFAMARVDSGDFGHVEPVAALDTIGVDPGFARKGYARAVLEQMVENLAALHVERLETEISNDAVELQKFLVRFGFGPSQRLSFQRVL